MQIDSDSMYNFISCFLHSEYSFCGYAILFHVHAKLLQLCLIPWTIAPSPSPPRLFYPRDSSGKNTGVGCHACPTPGIKPTSPMAPMLQVDSLLLSYWGSPLFHVPTIYFLFFTVVYYTIEGIHDSLFIFHLPMNI